MRKGREDGGTRETGDGRWEMGCLSSHSPLHVAQTCCLPPNQWWKDGDQGMLRQRAIYAIAALPRRQPELNPSLILGMWKRKGGVSDRRYPSTPWGIYRDEVR